MIHFDLPSVGSGSHVLLLALTDTQEKLASVLDVALNGETTWQRQMPLGSGQAFLGKPQGTSRLFLVPLPSSRLRVVANELTLTLRGGSWIAYDALAMLEWNRAESEWMPPPNGCHLFAAAVLRKAIMASRIAGGRRSHQATISTSSGFRCRSCTQFCTQLIRQLSEPTF